MKKMMNSINTIMKTFKQYTKEKRENGAGEIPAPIHFKYGNHLRLNEEVSDWLKKTDNEHLSTHNMPDIRNREISSKLAGSKKKRPEHSEAITNYTGSESGELNARLIKKKKLSKEHAEVAGGLDKAIDNNPLPVKASTYSGVSFDPRKHLDKNNRMYSPAYISTTHDKNVAHTYSQQGSGDRHIIKFHLKKGDPATHVEGYSEHQGEYETIIKRGQTLQHEKTESHQDSKTKTTLHVHHMSIV